MILNENKQKTKVAESFRNPVFEEFSSTFIFPVRVAMGRLQQATTLVKFNIKTENFQLNPMGNEVFFEVWDKDRLSKDDLMGKVAIRMILQLKQTQSSNRE